MLLYFLQSTVCQITGSIWIWSTHRFLPWINFSIVYPLLLRTNIMGLRPNRSMGDISCTVNWLTYQASVKTMETEGRSHSQTSIADEENNTVQSNIASRQGSTEAATYRPANASPEYLANQHWLRRQRHFQDSEIGGSWKDNQLPFNWPGRGYIPVSVTMTSFGLKK